MARYVPWIAFLTFSGIVLTQVNSCFSTLYGSPLVANAPVRAGVDDGPEALQPIRNHFSVRRKMPARPAVNRFAKKAYQVRHVHAQRPSVGNAGHGGDKRRLSSLTASALAAPALTAPERVVDLYGAGQRLAVVALAHGLHDLVLKQPGGVVEHVEQLKVPAQRHGRNFRLALRKHKNGQEQSREGQFSVLEQCSGR